MSEHTKGPWRYTVSEGSNYCRIYCHNDPHEEDNLAGYCGEANARLIAAAPELLRALHILCDAADESDKEGYGTLSTSFVLEIVLEAIAKAKGEA